VLTGTVSVVDNHDFWASPTNGVNAMAKFKPARGIETYLGYDFIKITPAETSFW